MRRAGRPAPGATTTLADLQGWFCPTPDSAFGSPHRRCPWSQCYGRMGPCARVDHPRAADIDQTGHALASVQHPQHSFDPVTDEAGHADLRIFVGRNVVRIAQCPHGKIRHLEIRNATPPLAACTSADSEYARHLSGHPASPATDETPGCAAPGSTSVASTTHQRGHVCAMWRGLQMHVEDAAPAPAEPRPRAVHGTLRVIAWPPATPRRPRAGHRPSGRALRRRHPK